MSSQPAAFWIVWSPQGSQPPRSRHGSINTAEAEAKRLAGQNPGKDFYVLRCVGHAILPVVRGVEYTMHDGYLDMDVPF